LLFRDRAEGFYGPTEQERLLVVKRFTFRLDKVLKVKEQRQRVAELRQQQARLTVEGVRAEIAGHWQELQGTASALEAQLGRPVPSGAWGGYYEHSTKVGENLRTAEARLKRASAELEIASAARTKITSEVEALLTLRAHQWQVHREEAALVQQNQLDELALNRWQAMHSQGAGTQQR
jgi:flagellar export protein FliJ